MVWVGRLEKILEAIGELPHMALENTLGGSDVFFIRIVGRLVVVIIIIAASSNYNPLGALLWPPLTTFGAPLSSFPSCLGRCPSATTEDHLPIALDEDGLDCLLTEGVLGGNVKQLLCGLRLITVEFMH
jgi:hypothetical protein